MMKKTKNINVGKMQGLEWELMRPGGMLVQKRNSDDTRTPSKPIIPTIKVLVKYGSSHLEIHVNSHASFGELKKLLSKPTGLHPQEQKLVFKDKERESRLFLDPCGVKHGSKIVLLEDIISQYKGFLELRRSATMDKALKSIAEVTLVVDTLVSQVAAVESVICKGGRVAEKDLLTLIELLMSQMIKLDGIVADADVKSKRKMQVIRIQKYIENLDRLKVQNAMPSRRGGGGHVGLIVSQQQQRPLLAQQLREHRNFSSAQINLTTKWDKF